MIVNHKIDWYKYSYKKPTVVDYYMAFVSMYEEAPELYLSEWDGKKFDIESKDAKVIYWAPEIEFEIVSYAMR